MENLFNPGDKVIMKKAPTDEQWAGIGKIPTDHINKVLNREIIVTGSGVNYSNKGWIALDNGTAYVYPAMCFELCEKESIDYKIKIIEDEL